MVSYRLETVRDEQGMFAVRAYSGDGETPCASSGGIFHSEEEAQAGILGMFELAWPAKDPIAVDPSIGV